MSAHPRVCGENTDDIDLNVIDEGSSPRVRGKPHDEHERLWRERLIPACAGKTFLPFMCVVWARAHPRVCGENVGTIEVARLTGGSSPRVRGKRGVTVDDQLLERLIPACAGKTGCATPIPTGAGAHPRVCGENEDVFPAGFLLVGSSPRVRGKPRRLRTSRARGGLIPACAGKTQMTFWDRSVRRAHPRVCGENVLCLA